MVYDINLLSRLLQPVNGQNKFKSNQLTEIFKMTYCEIQRHDALNMSRTVCARSKQEHIHKLKQSVDERKETMIATKIFY